MLFLRSISQITLGERFDALLWNKLLDIHFCLSCTMKDSAQEEVGCELFVQVSSEPDAFEFSVSNS